MTIPDLPDWTAGQSPISVSRLIDGGLTVHPFPFVGSLVDCSRFAAVALNLQTRGNTAAIVSEIEVAWFIAGAQVAVDTISSWNGFPQATLDGTVYWELPCKGDSMVVSADTHGQAGTFMYQVYGTTRVGVTEQIVSSVSQDPQLAAYAAGVLLNAGAGQNFYCGPFLTGVHTFFQSSVNTVQLSVQAVVYDSFNQISASVDHMNAVVSGQGYDTLVSRRALILNVHNFDTAAHTFNLTAIELAS